MPIELPKKPIKFKGSRSGPFRGPIGPKELQTLDIGTGEGSRFIAKANKRLERRYEGVDLSIGIEDKLGPNYEIISGERANNYIRDLIQKGITVRNINFDLPIPKNDVYRLEEFFTLLPKVLKPNGKVFFNSEDPDFLLGVLLLAKSHGFSYRVVNKNPFKTIPLKKILEYQKRTGKQYLINGVPASLYMLQLHQSGQNELLYQLELTYSLKLAYPNKERRKVWPH